MNAKRFRNALATLDMNQPAFADLVQISPRTARLYAQRGVTNTPTMVLINLMLMGLIKPDHIRHARTYRQL